MSERSLSGRVSTYDRRRLFEKNLTVGPITTMRDVNWEHQAVAMRAGYKSVGDMAIDELLDKIGELEGRVQALENPGCELVEDD